MSLNNTQIQDEILQFLENFPGSSSLQIHQGIAKASYSTIKRAITNLLKNGLIISEGQRRATKYQLSPGNKILQEIDMDAYFQTEIDERVIQLDFNIDLIRNVLKKIHLFNEEETVLLKELQTKYKKSIINLSKDIYNKEMERLAIDLSWKSSQIEGNTYSLLETELLLKEKITASGKTKDEATMLLNHKEAIDFLIEHPDYLIPLRISNIEDIHRILMKDLPVDKNVRKYRVGITGTNYKPLDNEFQIRDALNEMCDLINLKEDVFEKSLLALVLISYIQPFVDGNKRTARIVSNAILMANQYCPISFRTINSIDYKKAMLIFYEQNNISAFKKIYIDQYSFAVNNYF